MESYFTTLFIRFFIFVTIIFPNEFQGIDLLPDKGFQPPAK
jgi:hypothetical protein